MLRSATLYLNEELQNIETSVFRFYTAQSDDFSFISMTEKTTLKSYFNQEENAKIPNLDVNVYFSIVFCHSHESVHK